VALKTAGKLDVLWSWTKVPKCSSVRIRSIAEENPYPDKTVQTGSATMLGERNCLCGKVYMVLQRSKDVERVAQGCR